MSAWWSWVPDVRGVRRGGERAYVLQGGAASVALLVLPRPFRGTDPELFLLIEARGADAATARWQFAAARMTNMAELRLRHQEKPVWQVELLPWKDVSGSHKLPYTAFTLNEIPDFLKDALPRRKL